jgi:hypothetical protein
MDHRRVAGLRSARVLACRTRRPGQVHSGHGGSRGCFSARAPKTAREAHALPRVRARRLFR